MAKVWHVHNTTIGLVWALLEGKKAPRRLEQAPHRQGVTVHRQGVTVRTDRLCRDLSPS